MYGRGLIATCKPHGGRRTRGDDCDMVVVQIRRFGFAEEIRRFRANDVNESENSRHAEYMYTRTERMCAHEKRT